MNQTLRLLVGCVAVSGCVCSAPGQGSDEDAEARQLERRSREAPVVFPSTGGPAPTPGSGNSVLRPSAGSLVREGAFLRDRRGRLVSGPEGEMVYVFDPDETGASEPAMLLQRSRLLEEMKHVADSRSVTTTFVTTGQVFVFEGRNYFLPTFFSALGEEEARAETGGAEAGASPSATDSDAGGGAEELLKSMGAGEGREALRSRGESRRRDSASRTGGAGDAEEVRLLREGLTLASRRGRVSRLLSGELIFTTDNNASSRGGEPTLYLMPCLNLEALGELVRRRGDGVTVSLSGTVYVYGQRNYLLPTMYRVEADMDGNVIAGP